MGNDDLKKVLKMLSKETARPRPTRTDLVPPGAKRGEKIAFILDNVLTKDECDALIQCTEKQGYEQALLNVGGGRQILETRIRNNQRCIIDSTELGDEIWRRISEFIPAEVSNFPVIGLNERFRFLRYDPGEYFKPHFDGSFERPNGDHSLVTIQIYLNEGFSGGSTTFLPQPYRKGVDSKPVECVPKIGRVLVFEHHLYHEGSLLTKGRKYAVRTDVMFSPYQSFDGGKSQAGATG